ncbi:MAG: NUDIX domain-containing protein [Pseudomonadota bacterium]
MTEMIPTWMGGDLVAVDMLDVHQQGLRHRAVSVFLMHEAHLLIQRRSMTKAHTPGLWSSTCCSHPRWGEPSEACALRLLQEELGISAVVPIVASTPIEYRADVGSGMTDHEVVDVFVAEVAERPLIHASPELVMEVAWRRLPDLIASIAAEPENFTPWLRTCLLERRDLIFH